MPDIKSWKANRKTFFLAINTGYVEQGIPDQNCLDFYASRSGHGLYCSIVGNVVLPGGYGVNEKTAVISDSTKWKELAKCISHNGAVAGIQLANAWENYSGMKKFISHSPDAELQIYKTKVAHINNGDLEKIFQDLEKGSEIAVASGFKHIQLHAAHGYLFSLLVDNRIYKLADLAIEKISSWVHLLTKNGIESSLRFSLKTGVDNFDSTRDQFFANILTLPFDYFDVSSGYYNINKRLIYPSAEETLQDRWKETLELANHFPRSKFIVSGMSVKTHEITFPDNVHLGICRDLIANPNFLNEEINGCSKSMKCHYYSRGTSQLTCGRWNQEKA